MCEFKIINESDESQIAEDILVLFYTEDNELVFRDVLGMGEKLESALILDVNIQVKNLRRESTVRIFLS